MVADGLAVGMLTGFVGVGGGFLIVPVLVLLGGLELRKAIGTSLMIIALKSASGFYKYLDVLEQHALALDYAVIGQFTVLGTAGRSPRPCWATACRRRCCGASSAAS